MNTAVKKPVKIQYLTFDELVEYGKNNTDNIVDGMPWSFELNGYAITHENDECYLISTLEGVHNMTPNDVLIIGVKGEIYPCKKDIFIATYNTEKDTPPMIHLNNALDRLEGFTAGDIPLSAFISVQGNKLMVDIQNGTIPKNGVNGIQITDLLKYVKEVYISLDEAHPCKENLNTIKHIDKALQEQHYRTLDRETRGVEGKDKD